MKKVTSATIWNDSAGTRLSVTYSELDEATRRVIQDNVRENYVLLTTEETKKAQAVLNLAQTIVEAENGQQ